MIKFADDCAMIGWVSNDDDDTHYIQQIDRFVDYCDTNHLFLNVAKTKEMIIDLRKGPVDPDLVSIKGTEVERVVSYSYLGLGLDNKLNWQQYIYSLSKKINSRLYIVYENCVPLMSTRIYFRYFIVLPFIVL